MQIGDIVLAKDFTCLFKVVKIENDKFLGFNLLGQCEMVSFYKRNLLVLNHNNNLIRKLCKNEEHRFLVANVFCTNTNEKIDFLGVKERTVIRYNKKF